MQQGTQGEPQQDPLMPGPEYAEWLAACDHYIVASELAGADQHPQLLSLHRRRVLWQNHILCTALEVVLKAYLIYKDIGGNYQESRKEAEARVRP